MAANTEGSPMVEHRPWSWIADGTTGQGNPQWRLCGRNIFTSNISNASGLTHWSETLIPTYSKRSGRGPKRKKCPFLKSLQTVGFGEAKSGLSAALSRAWQLFQLYELCLVFEGKSRTLENKVCVKFIEEWWGASDEAQGQEQAQEPKDGLLPR